MTTLKTIISNSNPDLNPKNLGKDASNIIGIGNFGVVQKVYLKKPYALKTVDLNDIADTEEELAQELQSVYSEYEKLRNDLPNVVRSYDYFYDDQKKTFSFSMDYIDGISLNNFMDKRTKSLPFEEFIPIFKDIVTGLYQLFTKAKTVHCDLKPENILINENRKAFIIDIGVSKFLENTITGIKTNQTINKPAGTLVWMAPEMHTAFISDEKSRTDFSKLDIFSLGLISLHILDTMEFNKNFLRYNVDEKFLKDYLEKLEKKGLISDKEFFIVLTKMLSYPVDKRISILSLYEWVHHQDCKIEEKEKRKIDHLNEKCKELQIMLSKTMEKLAAATKQVLFLDI